MALAVQRNFCNLSLMKKYLNYKELSTWCRISDVMRRNGEPGTEVKVKGWIKSSRKMKELIFMDINDGSCAEKLQVVISKNLKDPNMTFGSSVEVDGTLKTNPINNQLEVVAKSVKLIGTCDSNNGFPFANRKSYPDEYVRQFPHFRARHSTFACVMRLRDAAVRGLHAVLDEKGLVFVHTPILTSNDCEGAGEVFSVTPSSEELKKAMNKEGLPIDEAYFNSKAYLTVSGQLHLEAAVRGLSAVYSFGPVFRAENSRSRLHLSEFYMLEAELAFSEDLEDCMTLAEDLVKGAAAKILERCPQDLASLGKSANSNILGRIENLVGGGPFPRVPYSEVLNILKTHSSRLDVPPPQAGETLRKEHELFLSSHFSSSEDQPGFAFVTHWPASIKPFYMRRSHENPEQMLAFDLLGPVAGEVCGGSVREPSADVLETSLKQNEAGRAALQALQWYLDIRRHGNVPTSGFGLGFERYLQSLLGIPNIKDTLPFPRWPHSLRM